MKTIEQLNKIRVEKRIEVDLRKNPYAAPREQHILVCNGNRLLSLKRLQRLDKFSNITL